MKVYRIIYLDHLYSYYKLSLDVHCESKPVIYYNDNNDGFTISVDGIEFIMNADFVRMFGCNINDN